MPLQKLLSWKALSRNSLTRCLTCIVNMLEYVPATIIVTARTAQHATGVARGNPTSPSRLEVDVLACTSEMRSTWEWE